MTADSEIVLENGEFYVAGERVEHRPCDSYQLGGKEFPVVKEHEDFYISGKRLRGAKSNSRRKPQSSA